MTININKITLESKIHFSNSFWAFNADGMICDLNDAEYIDIGTDEYKKVNDNEYQLISPN